MNESRETTIILIIIFLVLVGSLVGISVTVYSLVQTTGDIFSSPERSKVPSVFRKPQDTSSTPQPTSEYKFPDSYTFGVGEEGAYRLFTGELSYDFPFFEKTELNRTLEIDTEDLDPGLYYDLIKKYVEEDKTVNEDFFVVEIPRLGMRSLIYQNMEVNEAVKQGWWLLPSTKNKTEGEKILFCERNAFKITDPRNCSYLNKVKNEDFILIYSKDGELLVYEVISTSVSQERVDTILKPSDDKFLRIITSSDEDGGILGKDYRIVILAQLIEQEAE